MFRAPMFRALVLGVAAALTACTPSASVEIEPLPAPVDDYAPLAGYAEMTIPADNPLTPEKAALGKQLYYDFRLSGDGSRSCYSCHQCETGLSDGRPVAIGAFDKALTRNSPTMWNIGFHSLWYWDGRATTLEAQAAAAWKGANMGATDVAPVLATLHGVPGYRERFEAVFGEPATADNVPMALAAYMRTIVGGNTPFDRWQAGDEGAVGDAAQRGYAVFQQAGCAECHTGVLLTDMVFHNVGIGYDAATGTFADVGRSKVSNAARDEGAFKTPTLRDVAQSGPYFHDGSVADLEEAVRLMVKGGIANPQLDQKLKPADLDEQQIADLIAFLHALDEDCESRPPTLPR